MALILLVMIFERMLLTSLFEQQEFRLIFQGYANDHHELVLMQLHNLTSIRQS
jgi:hypothetical protein